MSHRVMTASYLLWIAVALVALLALSFLSTLVWIRYWRRALRLPDPFDSLVDLRSSDGAIIRIARILPVGDPSTLPPVVMCHGFGMNRLAFAYDRESSLAGALSRAGRDVWLVELRGAGRTRYDDKHEDSSFDTYAEIDVPAAIAYVLGETGASEVDWVGFSMGGMLAYAHLGALRGGRIRRLVTIGSPMFFRLRVAGDPLRHATSRPVHFFARTPFDFASSLVAPLMGPWMPVVITPGLRASHYSAARLRRILENVMADAPRGVTHQFARWLSAPHVDSNDAARRYVPALADVTVPARIIAGSKDRLAPPRSVKVAYDALGSTEKDFVVIGPESGAPDDFDHLDLILGDHAAAHVFPRVIDWLGRGP